MKNFCLIRLTERRIVLPPTIIFFLAAGLALFQGCSKPDQPLFERIPSGASGVDFVNSIRESDSLNILDFEYMYNGAGIAAGDFNQNGYPDLFFVGNMVENRLYLNHGDFTFTDITGEAGVGGSIEKWYSGVSVVDINRNGLPDIYICATGSSNPELRRNELYVNQGLNERGIPVFEEMAAQYGLDDPSYSTQAFFFDSNNNGDLDLYLLVAYSGSEVSYVNIAAQRQAAEEANRDKLFQSRWDDELGHPVFRDVSEETGITKEGHGLGANIVDLNGNGYKDIYVANDYVANDLLWVNRGDGTFTDMAGSLFKHTSFSAMGIDIADINNSGRLDIFTLDMLPEVNVRRKMMANPNNYRNYVNRAFAGFDPQVTRNTLQLNLGPADSTNLPLFSEIALLAGIAETDWSWAPLFVDLDNDGYRDLIITNGILKDITDKDFWNEYGRVRGVMPKSMALSKIPGVKIANYVFKNNGALPGGGSAVTFRNMTRAWGFDEPTFSTGAVYADLNNNGAMDIIINNIDQPAFIYRNTLYDNNTGEDDKARNWLKIRFKGNERNPMGQGAVADLFWRDPLSPDRIPAGPGLKSDGPMHRTTMQTYEHTLYRGYLSSVDPVAHFGLGAASVVDSVVVTWPDSGSGSIKRQVFREVEVNQTLVSDYSAASPQESLPVKKPEPLFRDVTEQKGISYIHTGRDMNDFREQPLLPYKLSRRGPALAAGDISGNGLDDLFIGTSSGQSRSMGIILYQQEDGSFMESIFTPKEPDELSTLYRSGEAQGMPGSFIISSAVLFDANGNGRLDLYVVGEKEGEEDKTVNGRPDYRDYFFRNDGGGQFTWLPDAVTDMSLFGSVVTAADYNGNGRPDLFVGGKAAPGRYPEPVSSRLLRNDSAAGEIRFTDVTAEVAPMLIDIGVVNDAFWTDFNNNGKPDMVIAGDWMPLIFLENRSSPDNEMFTDVTEKAGVSGKTGWWNTIAAADFTNNGFTDYVAGNLGLNSLYRASKEEPASIWFGDLTGDGFFEAIPTLYITDTDGRKKEFPAHSRDDMIREMPVISGRFPTHEAYGEATIHQLLTHEEMNRATVYRATHFESSLFLNRGDGTFDVIPLPMDAQASPVFGIIASDLNRNGQPDLILSGNHFGADLQVGQYDALNGLFLQGVEHTNPAGEGDTEVRFVPLYPAESGILIPGEGRSLVTLGSAGGRTLIGAAQHGGTFRLFEGVVDPD